MDLAIPEDKQKEADDIMMECNRIANLIDQAFSEAEAEAKTEQEYVSEQQAKE